MPYITGAYRRVRVADVRKSGRISEPKGYVRCSII